MAKKQIPKTAPPVDIVDQALSVTPDGIEVATLGRAVLDFMSSLGGFLATAKAIEESAVQTLERARNFQVPKTPADDAALVRFAIGCGDDLKVATNHWAITTAVTRFRNVLSGARSRATDPLEKAKQIATDHHNRFTEDANRRAREEEDRRRREAEDRARRDREAEQQRAEEDAARREAEAPELSEREERFVEFILAGRAPVDAARIAGYKNAMTAGPQLYAREKIAKAIAARTEAVAIREQAAARAAQPLEVDAVDVQPERERVAGVHDRTTHSAEILNEQKLIEAVIQGGHGIPWDILTVKPAVVNKYAVTLKEQINRWPGVRYKKTTGVTR